MDVADAALAYYNAQHPDAPKSNTEQLSNDDYNDYTKNALISHVPGSANEGKYYASGGTELSGTYPNTFALSEADDLLESFTTIAGTKITIIGLDLEDTYYLVELEAPAGYNKLKDPVEVKVNAQNTYFVEVPNSTGTELPSTGGMGTTLFYVFGSVLVIGAAVLLITKKRVGADV